jgi:hypothetical protein
MQISSAFSPEYNRLHRIPQIYIGLHSSFKWLKATKLRLIILVNQENSKTVNFDRRLHLPLSFVCKILSVSREDFATLSIANLLEEELDWIEHNNHNGELQIDGEKLGTHREIVKKVKYEADSWILK